MTDPREPTESQDPNRFTPDLDDADRDAADRARDEQRTDTDELVEGGRGPGPDADELGADNPVEQDTLETIDPENPPA